MRIPERKGVSASDRSSRWADSFAKLALEAAIDGDDPTKARLAFDAYR
jgi:hypothetical protein